MRRAQIGNPPNTRGPRDPTVQWLINAVMELQAASHEETPEQFQPLDATLTALAALDSTAGLLRQTGADAFDRVTFAVSTWTPTFTNVTNIAASTPNASYYLRFGDQVICWGSGSIDPTAAAGTSSELGISLPIASNLAAAGDLAGTAASRTNNPGIVTGDTTNDRAQLLFNAQDTANVAWSFIFGYRII